MKTLIKITPKSPKGDFLGTPLGVGGNFNDESSRPTTRSGQTTPDDSSLIQGLCPHRPEKTTNSFIKITTS